MNTVEMYVNDCSDDDENVELLIHVTSREIIMKNYKPRDYWIRTNSRAGKLNTHNQLIVNKLD